MSFPPRQGLRIFILDKVHVHTTAHVYVRTYVHMHASWGRGGEGMHVGGGEVASC